jgi:hypothetical protein
MSGTLYGYQILIGGGGMTNELRNQTLVAAELAKQSGFEHTYRALMDLVRGGYETEHDLTRFGGQKAVQ